LFDEYDKCINQFDLINESSDVYLFSRFKNKRRKSDFSRFQDDNYNNSMMMMIDLLNSVFAKEYD
jgi:hypothetical protein